MGYDDFGEYEEYERPPDPKQEEARSHLERFFEENKEEVFFSRQIEVQNEAKYFHWITNRAITELKDAGLIYSETRNLNWGGRITIFWHNSYRYPRRKAAALVKLVEEYSSPQIGGLLGLHGEIMVLEGFSRFQFVRLGRNVNEYGGNKWERSEHNLDFIFERDGIPYGLEIKNTLGYMDYDEFKTKKQICLHLGLKPVFVVRMIPKSWIKELNDAGGFALILKYQLYPWTHKELAKKVSTKLNLPVDAPRELQEGTMLRFVKWHEKNL